MSLTARSRSYNAKRLDASKRKQLALDTIERAQPITELAEANQVLVVSSFISNVIKLWMLSTMLLNLLLKIRKYCFICR